jgi:hypothetical protein
MNQCDVAKEGRLACAVVRKMEPRCQQGLSGLLLSGRVISPAQGPLPRNTRHSQETDIHAPGRYSNTQSQQANGRRPTP